jgi:DNA-binding MarR family transcriptional regulator
MRLRDEPAGSDEQPGEATAAPEPAPLQYGVLRDSIGYQLHLAQLASMQTFGEAFERTGVTPAMLTALELIARNPGIRPATLARAMAVETSNLAALLRRLESNGWLTHGHSADRRAKPLTLTAAGLRRMTGLRSRLQRHDARLTDGLSPSDRATLTGLIARLLGG